MEIVLIILFSIATAFAAFNGFMILWEQNIRGKRLTWSKIWHSIGRVVLGIPIIALWYFYVEPKELLWLFLLTCFNMSWTYWDLLINAIRKWGGTKISYLHGHKGMNDIAFKICLEKLWLYWGARFAPIAANIILLIYFLQ